MPEYDGLPVNQDQLPGPDQIAPQDRSSGGLNALGWAFVAGSLGFGIYRNVPSYLKTKALIALEEMVSSGMDKIPFLKKIVPALAETFEKYENTGINPISVTKTVESKLRGNYLEHDVKALHNIYKSYTAGKLGGNVHDVTAGVFEHYFLDNVKDAYHYTDSVVANKLGGWQSATWEHLAKIAASGKTAIDDITVQNPWLKGVTAPIDKLRELMALPAMDVQARQFLKSKGQYFSDMLDAGVSPWSFFSVGQGVYTKLPSNLTSASSPALFAGALASKSIAFSNTNRFSASNILESLAQVKLPVVGFKPFQTLFPTELARRGPGIATIDSGIENELGTASQFNRYLSSGGKIFGIKTISQGSNGFYEEISNTLAEGYQLGRIRSGMGSAYLNRVGQHIQVSRPPRQPGPFLQKLDAIDQSTAAYLGTKPTGVSTFFNNILDSISAFGERFGLSTAYRTNPEDRGLIGNTIARLHQVAHQGIEITEPFASGRAKPLPPGTSPFWEGIQKTLGIDTQAPVKTTADLSWFERTLLAIGHEPKRKVLLESKLPGGGSILKEQRIPIARFGTDKIPAINDHYGGKFGFYATKPIKGLSDFANNVFSRAGWLFEQTLGLGLKPGRGPLGTLGKYLGLAGLTYAGTQALGYMDYKIKQLSGVSPTEAASAGLLYSHYGQLKLQEGLGITAGAKKLEDLYPGIESSTLSKGTRAAAFALGGAWLGKYFHSPLLGFAGGALLGAVSATTDFTKPANEFLDEIEGRKSVITKRSRWWGLGRQPFEGEGAQMALPHWFQRMRSDYEDVSVYGSKSESWRGSWMPTPENLFLLKNLFDPYYVERRHYYSRPYPTSAPLFNEIPIVGSLLSATVGRVIKPQISMHQDAYRFPLTIPTTSSPSDIEAQIGFTPTYGQIFPSDRKLRQRLDIALADTIYKLKELSGLPGFMYESMANSVGFRMQHAPMAQDAGAITSTARQYYDQGMGGLFGMTELLRRFITPENKWDTINNVPGMYLPDWLPGRRSVFKRDRRSVSDFHTGDPYARIQAGEARLPGAGYEQLHQLHSGQSGVYDPVDRFMVLADVAPTSAAFSSYKTIVSKWQRAGLLNDFWSKKYFEGLEIAKQRTQQLEPGDQRRYTRQNFWDTNLTINAVTGPGQFEANGKIFKLAGVDADVSRIMYRRGLQPADAGGIRNKVNELDAQLRSMVGQKVRVKAGMRDDDAFPVVIEGFNDRFIQEGLGNDELDPLSTYARHGGVHPLASAWEHVRHAELPGPIGWPLNKLFTRYDAVEQYRRKEIEGADFAGWNAPVNNFLKPWFKQTYHFITGSNRPWGDTIAQRQTDTYFDNLQYYKYRKAQVAASQLGDPSAKNMEQMWRRTMIGMRAPGANWMRDAYGAMPGRERKYFDSFRRVQDQQDRKKILEMVPTEMQPIYMGVWNSLDPSVDGPMPKTFMQKGAMRGPLQMSQENVDSSVASFMSSHAIPENTWYGWNPSVNTDDVKIATILKAGQDIHQAGFFESQVRSIRVSRPYMLGQGAPEAFTSETSTDWSRYRRIMDQFGSATPTFTGQSSVRIRRKKNFSRDARGYQQGQNSRFR